MAVYVSRGVWQAMTGPGDVLIGRLDGLARALGGRS